MKILLYSLNYAPELTGIGKYSGELGGWLAERSHDVRVICGLPYYPEWRIDESYSTHGYTHEYLNGVRVTRCPLWVPERPGGLKRILHLLSFALTSLPALFLSLRHHPDVIIIVAPALFCAPSAWLAARCSGAKCWLHIQDFEVDAAFDLGLLKGSLIRRGVTASERWLLQRFDRLSTISERMRERLLSKTAGNKSPVLFPNWVDLQHIFPLQGKNPLRQEFGIASDKLVLLYSGNMGQKQGLEMVVEAAKRLTEQPRYQFVMCGDGVAHERLQTMAAGLKNILWLPLQPTEQLNALLNLADIHLLPQSADVADLVMPSKLTGMLASGRPVIATAAPGTQVATAVAQAGCVVPPGDVSSLVDTILRLADDPDLRRQLGETGRQWITQTSEKESILLAFEHELQQLIEKRSKEINPSSAKAKQ